MKSKTLYSNFLHRQFKRQIWIMALMTLAFFLAMPVRFFMLMDNWTSSGFSTIQELQEYFVSNLVTSNAITFVVAAAAIFSGIYHFWYLHSEKQINFYYSFPFSREKQYMGKLLLSYLHFILPYTLMTVFNLLLGWSRGLLTPKALAIAAECWALDHVAYLLIYLATTIAMLLTGRLIVGIMGTGVVLGFGIFLEKVVSGYENEFFSTFIEEYTHRGLLKYLSPVYFGQGGKAFLLEGFWAGENVNGWLVLRLLAGAAAVVGMIFIGRLLIKKRPAEAAGKSMAFPKTARIIHIVLSIGGALWFGLFVKRMLYTKGTFWLIAAVAFAALFLYGLIQFIYTMDVRKIFSYKWQIILVEIVSVGTACLFCFDLLGYDTYLPNEENIKNITISPDSYGYSSNYYVNGKYVNYNTYRLENAQAGRVEELYGMMQRIVKAQADVKSSDDANKLVNLQVRYTLDNNREVNRNYHIDVQEYIPEFTKLLDEQEFRNNIYPILGSMGDNVRDIYMTYGGDTRMLLLKADDPKQKEFMEIYRKEMRALPGHVFMEETPIAILDMKFEKEMGVSSAMYLYPSCTETQKYLKAMGWNVEPLLTAKRIKKIMISDYRSDVKKENAALAGTVGQTVYPDTKGDLTQKEYAGKSEIEAIAPALIDLNCQDYWQSACPDVYAEVTLEGPNGYDIVMQCTLRKDNFPGLLN